MKAHSFTYNDFYGTNNIGDPCHTYQLRDNGEVIYTLHSLLKEDGGEYQSAFELFYRRSEYLIQKILNEDREYTN